MVLVFACICSGYGQSADETEESLVWDRTFNVRTGFGYKDNVLLSPARLQDSSYFLSGFDIMLLRLPIDGPQFLLFVTGDDYRYLDDPGVDKEQSFVAVSKIEQEFAAHWKAALGLDYFYQNQVFDVSATEADLTTVQLQAHTIRATPSIERKLGRVYHLKLELPVNRQYLREPLDDYWEAGPKLAFQRDYGRRSMLWVSYEFEERWYDDRHETDREGFSIPGTSLRFDQHEIELGNRHYWDEKRRWRTDSKFAVEFNRDNGSGFFDYDRYQFSQQFRYTAPKWMVRAQGKVSYYDYSIQRASADRSETREFTTVAVTLRGERTLIKSLKLFAEYNFEQALSNRALHEYEANSVFGGIDWEF